MHDYVIFHIEAAHKPDIPTEHISAMPDMQIS